jgi:hypothetical protein
MGMLYVVAAATPARTVCHPNSSSTRRYQHVMSARHVRAPHAALPFATHMRAHSHGTLPSNDHTAVATETLPNRLPLGCRRTQTVRRSTARWLRRCRPAALDAVEFEQVASISTHLDTRLGSIGTQRTCVFAGARTAVSDRWWDGGRVDAHAHNTRFVNNLLYVVARFTNDRTCTQNA